MISHFEHEHQIGDTVFHAVEENKKGIIVDVRYSLSSGLIEYNVIFGVLTSEDVWCSPIEISDTPNFN